MKKFKGFTLAEALIVLVILGIIAALTIPSILSNTEQHEYKSALKKAVSALNQAIEMNVALEAYGPIETVSMVDNATNEMSLFNLFRKRMNVITTTSSYSKGGKPNYAFFTADGMRYEFPSVPSITTGGFSLTNSNCATPGMQVQDESGTNRDKPCLIIVDVNGERKPNPRKEGTYKVPDVTSRSRVLDVFPIMVTDMVAQPFGIVAQRAIFQSD